MPSQPRHAALWVHGDAIYRINVWRAGWTTPMLSFNESIKALLSFALRFEEDIKTEGRVPDSRQAKPMKVSTEVRDLASGFARSRGIKTVDAVSILIQFSILELNRRKNSNLPNTKKAIANAIAPKKCT